MTVRLDEETHRQLIELAEHQPSGSAAVTAAIHEAWQRHREEQLDAAAVAQNPNFPYESGDERAWLRDRRNAREARR